jgi:carboxypeptidase Taq
MQICRSRPFLAYLAPLLADSFGVGAAAYSVDNLYRHAIRAERGLIRVDADEVTYPLHIVLRYRLEKALLASELEVADLPTAWNEGMRELLGVVPPDDRRGVLQDIHWPSGAIGYFPCYTLGAILAAQLYEAMIGAVPDLPAHIAEGDFRPLLAWLRANVHEEGARYETQELIVRATGRPLELQPFLLHLETRYLA